MIRRLWAKAKDFLLWVWNECKDWRTLALLGIVCLAVGFPVWAGYLVGFLFHWEWALWVATICWGFWMLPGAPFITLCVTITLLIKRFFEKRRKNQRNKPD